MFYDNVLDYSINFLLIVIVTIVQLH